MQPLRFAIMARGLTLEHWESQSICKLVAAGAEPALLIIDDRPAPPPKPVWQKIPTLWRSKQALWNAYLQYVAIPRIGSRRPVDMSDVLGRVPQVSCQIIRKGKFSEYFSDNDLDTIRARDLDFMLRFAFNIIRGGILNAARHGVWSFHHGHIDRYRGGPPCFWELVNREPQTHITLQRLTERLDGGVVLKTGSFATKQTYAENLDAGLQLGVRWPAEVCEDIRAGRAAYLEAAPSASSGPIYYPPDNRQMLQFLFKKRAGA